MKRILKFSCLLFLVLSLIRQGYSQPDTVMTGTLTVSRAYLDVGLGVYYHGIGGVVGGNIILSNNWGVNIRYNPATFDAKNLPADYVDLVLFIPFATQGIPADNVKAFSIFIVRDIPTRFNLLRFGFELGPSFIRYEEAIFTPIDNWIPFFGSNYDVSHDEYNCIGFSLLLKAEFPVTRFAGVEIAPFLGVNRFRNVAGVDLCVTLGLLRKNKR